MPLAEELVSDPTITTRWSYQDPSDPALPDDNPSLPFCARHAVTIARLTRTSFGPHLLASSLPPRSLRDWHFGKLDDVLARREWCRACALIADSVDTVAYGGEAEVIACWVWDGVIYDGDGGAAETAMRLRIAPEMVGWESSFEPLDLVPLEIDAPASNSEQNLFTGRRVTAGHFDMSIVKTWITSCAEWHGSECVDTTEWKTSDWGVPFIRLISLIDDRLVECASPPPYAALSYVWGSATVFKTSKGNREHLTLTLFWVYSICIVQDSPDNKAQQIRIMDGIYSRANLTIVAAAGAHADVGNIRP